MADREKQAIPIGLHAAIEQLDLKLPRPIVRSELASGTRKTKITHNQILEQYPRSYQPAEGIVGQLRFALKYEPLDLEVYKSVFAYIPKMMLNAGYKANPTVFSPAGHGTCTKCSRRRLSMWRISRPART
jgi:hypothetical protein